MYDHTLNGKGYYLFVYKSSAEVNDTGARLTSILQTSTSTNQCFSFWYHMYGPDIGTLSLKVLQQGQAEELLWTRAGTHGNQWRRGFHTIPPQNKHFQLIFEAFQRGSTGAIAIDDVSVVGGACEAQGICSFEANTCQYTSTGMQGWEWLAGDPGTSSNRPVTDHTTETTEGDLNVYAEEETQEKQKVWSINTGQGLTWSLARVKIQTAHNWKLIFEAIGGGAAMSHIAIDDVTLSHTECPSIGACDFELDLCGWKNVLNPKLDSKDWDWTNGQTPSYFKGPKVDHTLGNSQGHYMFVDIEALNADETAWLLSEHLPLTKGSCLTFYHHINISKQLLHGALKVFQYRADQGPVIWETKEWHSSEWQSVNITVESSDNFQVGFKAMKSDSTLLGYIAIDDIVYHHGVNCHGVRTDEALLGSNYIAGMVAGVVTVLALVMFLLLGIIYWVMKNRISLPGTASESGQHGFDNLSYRNRN
ncbi:apical endosomal glycoprotein-like isoform X2 [Cetorhinus maximus]